ncbi:MAG: T9SS type A sorting domain-containing protein [Bacteroidota bacterium]
MVGIEEEAYSSIIHPNPTNDIVHVSIPNEQIQSIQLYSATGICLKEFSNPSFSVAHLPSGAYFLHVRTNQELHLFSLIKQ